jgi:hypothetical protein
VIWSGKGYHTYIPVDSKGKILEQMPKFRKFTKEPSKEFLRFAEWYLSNGKCDNEHVKNFWRETRCSKTNIGLPVWIESEFTKPVYFLYCEFWRKQSIELVI